MTKIKQNKRPRFPLLEKTYFARLITLNSEYAEPERIGSMLRSLLSPRQINLVGYRGARDLVQPVDFEAVPDLFSLKKERLVYLLAGCSPALEVSILWFPPEVFDCFVAPRMRMNLAFGFPEGWNYQDAEELFVSAVHALDPHWGELNRLAATKFPTLCSVNGHIRCVPHIGTTNYFGPEYCEFFGGIERIKSVGFERVVTLCEGVLTSLGEDLTHEAYMRCRGDIESRLASSEVFEPNASNELPCFRK